MFSSKENKTRVEYLTVNNKSIPKYINEFWTPKQRQSCSLHEISYRACFKAELPRFFINLLTQKDDVIYDSFSGRGTTVIEAGLMGRNIISNDINPLSKILTYPRFFVPTTEDVRSRLDKIPNKKIECDIDLSMFYHPDTLSELLCLRNHLKDNQDSVDKWIQMIATNRLTGHSNYYFSVYTLPPNQAVTAERQIAINKEKKQVPAYRNVKEIILKKHKSLISDLTASNIDNLEKIGKKGNFLCMDSRNSGIMENTVQLTVTSPPFLDVVQYADDNWLRCWFNQINEKEIKITQVKSLDEWCDFIKDVFKDLFRITKPNGYVAFEVGELKNGRFFRSKEKIKLEEYVIPLGMDVGFDCICAVINEQNFAKTSNIWGIKNNKTGTNSNRIVLFQKKGS